MEELWIATQGLNSDRLGGLYALNVLPSGLKSAYGAREPHGTMMFLRLKLR